MFSTDYIHTYVERGPVLEEYSILTNAAYSWSRCGRYTQRLKGEVSCHQRLLTGAQCRTGARSSSTNQPLAGSTTHTRIEFLTCLLKVPYFFNRYGGTYALFFTFKKCIRCFPPLKAKRNRFVILLFSPPKNRNSFHPDSSGAS